MTHAEYCMDTVRKYDYESFLCSLLLPSSARTSAFAVRAFNVDVAQIRDMVSDKNIGYMRMHFWKDSLEGIYKDVPPRSPVGLELHKAVKRHGLSKHWLKRIIEGRTENLSDQQFRSMKDMEDYAEQTVSSLYYLLLEILGIKNVNADHAASHIGKAQGLVTQLRAVPFNAGRQRVYLPLELMLLHDVSQEEVIRGSTEQKMKDVAYDIAGNAHQHLDKASIRNYLKILQQVDFNVFDSKLQQRNHWLPISLWMQRMRGKY
ncbi:NADH dehydrogenase (ubiquinone) complex I, assembly factor 6-like isoform X2 [Lineus longissimus]|uniref:NADH dehydrogenase (ubiquinone) complex I, assembly factor 6-like isoform X2 n=1 Tax=Lineus longissimus TaxID=88925 RepID=UPI00315D9D98